MRRLVRTRETLCDSLSVSWILRWIAVDESKGIVARQTLVQHSSTNAGRVRFYDDVDEGRMAVSRNLHATRVYA